MSALHGFVFGVYPYIALTVFLVGSLIRFDREPYTWKSDSSQLLRSGLLRWGSNLFHVGILFLFFGHLVGLLTPHAFYAHFMEASVKQQLGAGALAQRFRVQRLVGAVQGLAVDARDGGCRRRAGEIDGFELHEGRPVCGAGYPRAGLGVAAPAPGASDGRSGAAALPVVSRRRGRLRPAGTLSRRLRTSW